ncbi:MAG: hypothetical protein LBC85_09910 [Fibromonadaceae bacterium]|jgi:thiol-disulfide isomerase/thioredoxin|nr:hypothetical protein [Fibromonadaceae bacterium]
MNINKSLKNKKTELLNYFRNRAEEFLSEIKLTYGNMQFKEQASAINKSLIETKENLTSALLQKAEVENWTNREKLESILMITYTNYIVMLEARNDVWPYEYMTFSRRIGELWEPFCKHCFSYPIKDISLFIPPLFSEVKQKLSTEIEFYIDKLKILSEEKAQLRKYYNKVWGLVTSGEIKLELDLHFISSKQKFVVDFKSGFGSNEKGNTNRLLLVASIYQNLEENYKCIIFVRSTDNNHYFQTLKKSGIWYAYSGDKAYDKMKEYSGFDIKKWIVSNVDWKNDFKSDTIQYLKNNNLIQYLVW